MLYGLYFQTISICIKFIFNKLASEVDSCISRVDSSYVEVDSCKVRGRSIQMGWARLKKIKGGLD